MMAGGSHFEMRNGDFLIAFRVFPSQLPLGHKPDMMYIVVTKMEEKKESNDIRSRRSR